MKKIAGLITAVVLCLCKPLVGVAATVVDFEGPLPSGLTATSYAQGHFVPPTAYVRDRYLAQGLVVSDAALVEGGLGHAASGVNALAGVDGTGHVNYDQAVTFRFFVPGDANSRATTDYFAYSADFGGWSRNTVTISAFDLFDNLVGQVSYVETGTFTSPLSLSGFGQFHRITVDQTLLEANSGGIMLDLVQFGELAAASTVPEPNPLLLSAVAVGFLVRRKARRH